MTPPPEGHRPTRHRYRDEDGAQQYLSETALHLLRRVAAADRDLDARHVQAQLPTVRYGEDHNLWEVEWFYTDDETRSGPWKITGITEFGRRLLGTINIRTQEESRP